MPTMNRKQIATAVGQTGTEADVRATANYYVPLPQSPQKYLPAEGKSEPDSRKVVFIVTTMHYVYHSYTTYTGICS